MTPIRPSPRLCDHPIARLCCLAFVGLASPAQAQQADGLLSVPVQRQAGGVLALLGISAIPDSTASALNFRVGSGQDNRALFQASQVSGGFTWSEDFPLYLEGSIGYDRYNPDILVIGDGESARLRPKWTGIAATGGIGWDFKLAENLWLRPIANVTLGQVVTDTQYIAQFIADRLPEADVHFLRDGGLTAGGLGGSLALVYNRLWDSGVEADAVLRYTDIHLTPIGGDKDVMASASARTLALWSRLRTPNSMTAFGSPLRTVYELSASWLPGDQGEILDTDWLLQVGLGQEIDVRQTRLPWITAGRVVFRYTLGERLSGYGLGLAVSF